MKNLDALIRKAKRFINARGFFLLHYDVVGSVKFAEKHGYKILYGKLFKFHRKINRRFKNAIVIHDIGLNRKLPEFRTIVGDSGGAYFSNAKVIKPIIELVKKMLPFKLRWGIAKDGWDKKSFLKKNMKII